MLDWQLSGWAVSEHAAAALAGDGDACASTWPRASRSPSVSPLGSPRFAYLREPVSGEAAQGHERLRLNGMSLTERSRAALEGFELSRMSPPRRRSSVVLEREVAQTDECAMTWPWRGKLGPPPVTFLHGSSFRKKGAGRASRRGSIEKVVGVDAGVDARVDAEVDAGVDATADLDSDRLGIRVIAVVEDDDFSRAMIAMMLDTALGGTGAGAMGGGGALEHAEVTRSSEVLALALAPQGRALKLIIFYLNFDNGFSASLVKAIRSQPHLQRVALVAIAEIETPFGAPDEDFRAVQTALLAEGFDDVIPKPLRPEAVAGLVQRYVRG